MLLLKSYESFLTLWDRVRSFVGTSSPDEIFPGFFLTRKTNIMILHAQIVLEDSSFFFTTTVCLI